MKSKIVLLILYIFASIFIISTFYNTQFQHLTSTFRNITPQSPSYFYNLYKQRSLFHSFNVLLLGLDQRDDWLEHTSTTDTIMFANLNFDTGKINLLSLPRDLWDPVTKMKINAFYPESLSRDNKFDYLQDNYSRIIGQPIDKILIIKTSDLSQILSAMKHLDVYNETAFTDNQYPNPEYILDPHNPIYITVSYPSGWLRLNSSSSIPFIRSRKSLVNGSDLGRIHRQQELIDSFQYRLSSSQILLDILSFKDYYNSFHKLEANLTDQDITNLIFSSKKIPYKLSINKINISTSDSPQTSLIYHPQEFFTGQWVFLSSDPTYVKLHQYISQQLK